MVVEPRKRRRGRERLSRRQAGFLLQQLYDQLCHSVKEGTPEEDQLYWGVGKEKR